VPFRQLQTSDIRFRVQNDVERKHHLAIQGQVLEATEAIKTQIVTDTSSVKTHVSTTAEATIATLTNHINHSTGELLTKTRETMHQLLDDLAPNDQARTQMMAQALYSTLSLPGNLAFSTNIRSRSYPCRKAHRKDMRRSKRKKIVGHHCRVPGSFPGNTSVCRTLESSTPMPHISNGKACCLDDASRAVCVLLLTALYASPQSRKLALRLWMQVQADPALGFLCLLCVIFVQRLLFHLPKQVSLLSDNSITFEDVFGIEISIPYRQCEQFEFFHGFLEFYFRQRPGLQRVMQRQYRLLLGNSRGQMVERSNWNKTVKPKIRLTMAMFLISMQNKCAKCSGELAPCKKGSLQIW
jgi:hypothetical protein